MLSEIWHPEYLVFVGLGRAFAIHQHKLLLLDLSYQQAEHRMPVLLPLKKLFARFTNIHAVKFLQTALYYLEAVPKNTL